ncbi:MAG: type VI-B CRISPR accessory protein Csx27, partial [Paludibacter sp.]
MEKFSLYDLLAVLFPGVIFLYMLNIIREIFSIFPNYELTDSWEILLVMAIVSGGVIYVISFLLTSRLKWWYKITQMYQQISGLYQTSDIHETIGTVLNKRANEWYGNDIFFSQSDYNQLPESQKDEVCKLQDNFYDRMYYELDYAGKLTTPKSFQSFYLFFRNVFVATAISIFVLLMLYLVNLIPPFHFSTPDCGDTIISSIAFIF